jgi:hypothetical protein
MHKKIILIIALLFPIMGQTTPLSEPASLRQFMPPNAIGYIRIPNPWGLNDNGPLANEQNIQQLQKLKTAIHQNILVKGKEFIHPLVTLLLHHLRSPLEAVFLLPEQTPPAFTNIVLSAKLNFSSIDELNQFLKKLVAKMPSLQVKNELSTEGNGLLIVGPISIFLNYNLNSQRITLMTGLMVSPNLFQQTLAKFNSAAEPTKEHPMYEMENRIDTSHQGYFSWINLQKILPAIQANIPPSKLLKLQKWGILDFRAIGLGCGTRDGKGRLSLVIDAPRTGYRALFPAINNDLSITASGKPGSVISFSIPSLAWLKGFEEMITAEGDAYPQEKYQAFKQEFTQDFGFSIEDALAAFGPEIVFFTDNAGEFFAIKTGDKSKVQEILKIMVSKYGLTYETRDINGKVYHHLAVSPATLREHLAAEGETKTDAFGLLISSKLKSHYYWVEDEGYLIFATVPQPLFDRQLDTQRVPIQQWLTQEQRQNSQTSLFLISTTLADTPRYFYYIYLYSLEMLGDLADANIDLFSLPSANALKLPRNGTYGLQADVSESLLSLELTFENNPLEFLLTPEIGMQVAIVGILAAVAIPAYTKYLERAKGLSEESEESEETDESNETDESISNAIAEATVLLNGLKELSEEFYAIFGRLPEIKEIEEIWSIETEGEYSKIRLLESNTGYFVEFKDNSNLLGKLIILYDASSKTWTCTHEDLPEEYLPKDCK